MTEQEKEEYCLLKFGDCVKDLNGKVIMPVLSRESIIFYDTKGDVIIFPGKERKT